MVFKTGSVRVDLDDARLPGEVRGQHVDEALRCVDALHLLGPVILQDDLLVLDLDAVAELNDSSDEFSPPLAAGAELSGGPSGRGNAVGSSDGRFGPGTPGCQMGLAVAGRPAWRCGAAAEGSAA
ncbi:hypothetical protein [Catellatospora sichuanensis]|uniref:hypothetical protein n=1 Tax=Catellatospora sichuanensis TaxID=1969805 RepID=UPI001182F4E2|nr:hypothetical protein [Catellatospora sichuanensis]